MVSKIEGQLINNRINDNENWFKEEIAECDFKDERLNKRFRVLFKALWKGVGKSIPFACQDWANTKAAYRFLSNDKISENEILSGHFQSTKDRFTETEDYVLVMHDTTEFSYQRENSELIGMTHLLAKRKDKLGKPQYITKCGILMHASLAVTEEGLPLGLTAVKFWTRKKFKGCNALKRHINPTRVPIEKKESVRWSENLRQSTTLLNEPNRCIHIGDRESDIYELFCMARQVNTHFLVRTCVNRLAGDGSHTIADEIEETKAKGLHYVMLIDEKGKPNKVALEIKYRRIKVLPPVGKRKRYSELDVTVIHAEEKKKPKNRHKIVWKLMTDLPVNSRKDAIKMLDRYAMRWKIETFFKILKSGCKAESSKLRTASRIANLIAIFCILSWRIFWMTMLNRLSENIAPRFALTKNEINLLDQLVKNNHSDKLKKKSLAHYLVKVARLGGYLARASDPPPGNMVIWRGLMRLMDIQIGFDMASNTCG